MPLPVPAKPYRVDVTVRNANVLRAMERAGLPTVAALCRAMGRPNSQGYVGALINLTASPLAADGEWRPLTMALCAALHAMPCDLFAPEQLEPLTSHRATAEVSAEYAYALAHNPAADPADSDPRVGEALAAAVACLSPRLQRILSLRYGFDGAAHTIDACAEILGIPPWRVRRLEAFAMRKLRHPDSGLYKLLGDG
ncbi:MAG TPA: sigma factor-like helix-turn-helix DNA-binding protein [Nevskiaceae bacterium]|nr:sigma factor-like helix-turn-helix DNA-binding protein [Nevskiaceae bacterium]